MAAAGAYLHGVPPGGIVHRDLKSANILIDRRYNAKVTDFGCSKQRRTLRTVMSIDRGTVNWSAPEVLRGESDYTAGPYMIILSSSTLSRYIRLCNSTLSREVYSFQLNFKDACLNSACFLKRCRGAEKVQAGKMLLEFMLKRCRGA